MWTCPLGAPPSPEPSSLESALQTIAQCAPRDTALQNVLKPAECSARPLVPSQTEALSHGSCYRPRHSALRQHNRGAQSQKGPRAPGENRKHRIPFLLGDAAPKSLSHMLCRVACSTGDSAASVSLVACHVWCALQGSWIPSLNFAPDEMPTGPPRAGVQRVPSSRLCKAAVCAPKNGRLPRGLFGPSGVWLLVSSQVLISHFTPHRALR